MESLTLSVLRQGVMASLTGGWFHDPRLPQSSTRILKYTWISLLIAPMIIHGSLTISSWWPISASSNITSGESVDITTIDSNNKSTESLATSASMYSLQQQHQYQQLQQQQQQQQQQHISDNIKQITPDAIIALMIFKNPTNITHTDITIGRIIQSYTFLLWFLYAIIIGLTFTGLKIWNSKRQEPLLDLNLTKLETATSIILAVLVSIFGALLIQLNLWHDLWQILFCLVIASSQFTLLKSVQPDAASPAHGFNRVVSLSRPIYFCLLSTVLLLCQAYLKYGPAGRPSFLIYNFNILDKSVFSVISTLSLISILSFPLIFNLGLLPQITTFIMYLCEQIDMHMFGSTAATMGLKSAIYSLCRSLLAICFLYLTASVAISAPGSTAFHNALFSLYCGALIAVSYALSRSSSDPTILFRLVQKHLIPAIMSIVKYPIIGSDKCPVMYKRAKPKKHGDAAKKMDELNSEAYRIEEPSGDAMGSFDTSDRPTESYEMETITTTSTCPPQTLTMISEPDTDFNSSSPIKKQLSIEVKSLQTNRDSDVNSFVSTINTATYDSQQPSTSQQADNQSSAAATSSNVRPAVANDGIFSPDEAGLGGDTTYDFDVTVNPIENVSEVDSHCGEENSDSISTKIQNDIDGIFIRRLKSDLICCIAALVGVFSLHVSSIFSVIPSPIEWTYVQVTILWGFIFHYVIPQMRKDSPWLCFSHPILKSDEYIYYEVKTYARLMWFERIYSWALLLERNVIYSILWLSAITKGAIQVKDLFGPNLGVLIFVIISLKLTRSSFNDSSPNYITLIFAYLFFEYDAARLNHHTFIVNYFFFSILYVKVQELLLKIKFILIYIAPWQIPWGSAFHAFAQPFSVPHSAILFGQAILSSILSAPLQPVVGSAIFLMSYVRPVRFWERDYNTNVIDINTTRLAAQLERNRIDANRLDGIFYENLTRCLQRKLCGDLALGRWGAISQGDCFIMASDNLNCLVHIVEIGNGLCTFQLRGLEFRGTYCQQQEVEAITESVSQDGGCCCCEPGHLPCLLSPNAAFNQRWLAWHVTNTKYVLEGYSISDNPAVAMLQPFDLRRALMTYYVKSIIYFTITSTQLSKWLKISNFVEALEYTRSKNFADLDPTFSFPLDLDFDMRLCGVTRARFCNCYYDWIKYCVQRIQTR